MSLLAAWEPGHSMAQVFGCGSARQAPQRGGAALQPTTLEGLRGRSLRYQLSADTAVAVQPRLRQQGSASQQQEARQVAYQVQALMYLELLARQPRRGYGVQFQPVAWRFDFVRAGPNAHQPVRLAPRLVREALPVFPFCQP